MNKRPIIIDTDPGIDDAVAIAIALFSDALDVRLITTVAGNVDLTKVTLNTLKLLSFFGKQIPVAKGAERPLIRTPVYASNVHGETGMDGYAFPEPDESLLMNIHGVHAMKNMLLSSREKLTIVAIGPLTNIALLLRMYPDAAEKIEELVIMGGSVNRGNSGVLSEFNFHCDPEAAKIVIDSGLKIAMAPLDVGLKALVYPEDSEKLKNMNKVGNMMYHLFKRYRGGSFNTGLKMYDSCAIAYLLCPEMFDMSFVHVSVEYKADMTAGASLVDLRGYLKKDPNVTVCLDIDEKRFKKWFMDSISACDEAVVD